MKGQKKGIEIAVWMKVPKIKQRRKNNQFDITETLIFNKYLGEYKAVLSVIYPFYTIWHINLVWEKTKRMNWRLENYAGF